MKGNFKMSFYYPVSLNIFNKKCSVIGGGKVAYRKTQSLLAAGAIVRLISPDVIDKIKNLAIDNKIIWIKKEFSQELIADSFLVIAATNNRGINNQIAKFCQKNNILVNVVDNINNSNFIVNSCIKQGDLTIAISTNGKSPALSSKIKEDLLKLFGPEYAVLLEILGEARELAKEKIIDEQERNNFFRKIVRTDILEIISAGRVDEARERVKKCLLSY